MSEEQQEVAVQSPGQILKSAREAAHLTTDDIAKHLRLKTKLIVDLEQDNYDINISVTFIKGYLKLYAKQVGVEEQVIVTAFDNLNTQQKEPAKLQSFSRRFSHQANDDKLMLVTYLVIAVVIALAVVFWFQQDSDGESFTAPLFSSNDSDSAPLVTKPASTNTESAPSSAEVAAPLTEINPAGSEQLQVNEARNSGSSQRESIAQPLATATEQAGAGVDLVVEPAQQYAQQTTPDLPAVEQDNSSDLVEGSPAQALQKVANAEQNSPAQNNTARDTIEQDSAGQASAALQESEVAQQASAEITVDEPAVPLADPVKLVFEFADNCWMNLADATGEDIAYGVKVKGRVMPVTGIPPFVVTLGAPEVVSISYDGEPVDMSFVVPGRSAKFDLPLVQ